MTLLGAALVIPATFLIAYILQAQPSNYYFPLYFCPKYSTCDLTATSILHSNPKIDKAALQVIVSFDLKLSFVLKVPGNSTYLSCFILLVQ